MNTMFKHRILAVALFFTTLLGFSSCVENGDRDLQVDNKTLYEVIAADNTLSDFWEIVNACSIEGRDFADSLFNHARVYTVWAPVNGSFDKEYWLNKIDEERENVVQTFVFSHVANHLRPANGELEKGNLVIMLNNKMASFEGSYKTKKYSFGGCEIFDSNQRVWNGLLHKLSGASEYRYNIWEFLKAGPEKMDGFSVDSVAKFLYSHNILD